jgi:RNA polymerase-binding transcription factor DksA
MAKNKKKPPAKKTVAKKPAAKSARPAPKKSPTSARKSAPAPKPAPAVAKAHPPSMEKPSKKTVLRDNILKLKQKAPVKPIVFSLDEVRAIAKTVTSRTNLPFAKGFMAAAKAPAKLLEVVKPAKSHHIKAASLSEILGFNPKRAKAPIPDLSKDVPEKYKRFYKLLLDLRNHLTAGITLHSEETLKRSSKDDTGDLSSYGQHMADAGTDTFDRDFALSLVSSEQEALSEIDAAIKRIHAGTYGICELTQKPISKDRLLAVPFTRHSAEAQKGLERNRYRARTAGGLFGELGEEGGKISDDDSSRGEE